MGLEVRDSKSVLQLCAELQEANGRVENLKQTLVGDLAKAANSLSLNICWVH
jgi:hypothetical protein